MHVRAELGRARLIQLKKGEIIDADSAARVSAIINAESIAITRERESWRIASDDRLRRRLHWARSPWGRFCRFFYDKGFRNAVLKNI